MEVTMLQGHQGTLPGLFRARVNCTPGRVAYLTPDPDLPVVTWSQLDELAQIAANGLLVEGVGPGDFVGIMVETNLYWQVIEQAVARVGAVAVTLYPSTGAAGVEHIVGDSGLRLMFVQDVAMETRLRDHSEVLGTLPMILVDSAGAGDRPTLSALIDKGRIAQGFGVTNAQVEAITAAIKPEQLCTIIYSSGTTGKPKGTMQSHGGWCDLALSAALTGLVNEDDLLYLWLPLAHAYGLQLTRLHMQVGFTVYLDGRVDRIAENLRTVRPTVLISVPRLLEKAVAGVLQNVARANAVKRLLFRLALADAKRQQRRRRRRGEPYHGPTGPAAKILQPVVDHFGGRLRFCISGGAALPESVALFFEAIGIPVLEGWGMTETGGGNTVNRPDDFVIGSIGTPMDGVEIMIAEPEDGRPFGELFIRGVGVMVGYWNRPDADAESFVVIDGGRWFRTGDLAEKVGDHYFHRGRRKGGNVKGSDGKYKPVDTLETDLIGAGQGYISQVLVVAEERPFVTALITLNEARIMTWARSQGLTGDLAEVAGSDEVRRLIQGCVDRLNAGFDKWERIGRFHIMPREFNQAEGETTAKESIKRPEVEAKYAAIIEAMYAKTGADKR